MRPHLVDARSALLEGGREGNGRNHSACDLIRVLARVDGKGSETKMRTPVSLWCHRFFERRIRWSVAPRGVRSKFRVFKLHIHRHRQSVYSAEPLSQVLLRVRALRHLRRLVRLRE